MDEGGAVRNVKKRRRGVRMMSRKDRETISALAALIYKQEEGIMNGKIKLSLTTNSLTVLSAGFVKLSDVECVENSQVVIAASPILMELQFLRQCMKKVPCIKIIHGTSTIQGRVDLTTLASLRHLEVKKAPIHLLEGLHVTRGQLLSITCSRSLQNLQDLFISCGGDMSRAHVWPALKAACLSCNSIEKLDESLRYLPVLEYLDLSYNHLVTTQHYLELLSELERINLGYNELTRVPTFSKPVSAKLRTLVLRNNNLDHLDGLEALTGLRELDLCDNCLAEHSKLNVLSKLHHIKSLNLTGNPLYYHVNHRPLSLQYLSPLAVRERGKLKHVLLDNKLVSESDKNYVPKDPMDVEATPAGQLLEPKPSTSGMGKVRSFDRMHQRVEAQIHSLDSSLPRDQLDNSRDSPYDSDQGSRQARKGRRKARSVVITDLESSTDLDLSINTDPGRGSSPFKPLPATEADRAEYEAARKQLGPDWLVTVNEKYFQQQHKTSPSQELNRSETLALGSGPFEFVGSPMDAKVSKEERKGSKEERRELVKRVSSEEVRVEWNWSQENVQEEVEGEPYIVTRKDGCQLMAVLGDFFLWETNLNNQICDKFDLRSLKDADYDSGTKNCVCLSFDTLRTDRKRRVYLMEDEKHARQFLELLSPHLLRADRGSGGQAMQCMKCNAKFTYNSKTGTVACPSCRGNIVIQIEDHDSSREIGTPVFGSVKSTDGLMTPLAASSAQTSPAKTVDSGDTSFRSMNDDLAGSVQSAASFKSIDDTESQSLNSFQSDSPAPASETSSRNTTASTTGYVTANERTVTSDDQSSYASLNTTTSSRDSSVTVINGFQMNDLPGGDAFPAKKANTKPHLTSSKENAVDTVTSCPSLVSSRNSLQREDYRDRSRLDSEESDITIISNPSSISILTNPSREAALAEILSNETGQKLSLTTQQSDRGMINEFLGLDQDVVVTDREDKSLSSPCGSLTTKTVTSMVDSMYERNLSPNVSSEMDECERTEEDTRVCTETFESPKHDAQSSMYNYQEFSVIDHRIQLWMAMSVLQDMEESQIILRCDVCRFGSTDLVPCLFIVTSTRIHFYKIIAPERGQPGEWLMVWAVYPKSSIRYVDIGYSYQWFQLEVVDALYSLVVRDEARCKAFMTAFTDSAGSHFLYALSPAVLEDNALSTRSELRGITKNQGSTLDNLQTLCDQEGDESVLKRLFAGHAVRGKGDTMPVTLVVTAERLYLAKQNYEWPAPRAFSQSATSAHAQFDVVSQRQINEVSCLNMYADAPLSVIISFFSEDVTCSDDSDWASSWMISMATHEALSALIDSIRTPWETEFGVQLQLVRQSVSPRSS